MKPAEEAPKDKKNLRTGFTTGACAAAAARAATHCLIHHVILSEVTAVLPNGQQVTFKLHRCERQGQQVIASIIKDGGDDPDCTHGAEIVATVRLTEQAGMVELAGGEGVAVVTKPGLGLDLNGPAINPVPRRNITEQVLAELIADQNYGAHVTISVPDGVERAKQTLNARLGLLGGISILGTTGIVYPYSTAAFIASVRQGIELAAATNTGAVVFTTGGRSETYAMKLLPHLAEAAFIQVGDYIGIAIRNAVRHQFRRIHIVGMMGKLSKMADGRMMTHASASEVNMALLAELAKEMGANPAICDEIRQANTARHVLEICAANNLGGITTLICRKVVERCSAFARVPIDFDVALVDFGGALLGRYPTIDTPPIQK